MSHRYLSKTADMTPHFDRVRAQLAAGPSDISFALILVLTTAASFVAGAAFAIGVL